MASPSEAHLRDWSVADAWRGLKKPVFIPSILIIVGALIFATWFGSTYGDEAFENLNTVIVDGVGWWYVLSATAFVIFALWVGLSRSGRIKLGRDDEEPEFSVISWFTMLFAAGMGIGLVFWGVAEPLNHFSAPPETTGEVGSDASGEAVMASQSALEGSAIGESLFHWGLHAWAIYVVVGLGLAYMTFRRGRPLSMRWLLEPIFGRKLTESWVGHVIDIVAIVGTVFGVVTSLGLGVQQVVAGLSFMGWAEESQGLLTALVIGIMAIATFSVVSGVHKGLKWLSNFNMLMAAVLALFVLLAGPTLFLFQSLVANTGEYAMAFPQFMFETGADFAGDTEGSWSADWTIYYWGWWMSWSPFVGMFIARISRGRTIREFVFGVLLAPTIIAIIWFTIFGSSGIWYQVTENVMLEDDGSVGTDTALFTLLGQLPLASITAFVAVLVIIFFFITSADSGSLVVDVLAYGGRPETPRLTRVFWTVLIAVASIVLLTAGGEAADAALRVLQVASISAAAPLSIVLVLAMIAQIRVYHYEGATMPRYVRIRPQASKSALVSAARDVAGSDEEAAVKRTLRQILSAQSRSLAGSMGATSATFGGLSSSKAQDDAAAGRNGSDDMVFAVHDIPASATTVNRETGVIDWDREDAYHDPIEHEVFETPEYAESAAGQQYASEQLYEETVSSSIPIVSADGSAESDSDADADDSEEKRDS